MSSVEVRCDTKDKIWVQERNAEKIIEWLRTRGGVKNWKSINLCKPGATMQSPAIDKDGNDYTKPRYDMIFDKLHTSFDDFIVGIDKEVKRFHVAVRMGSQGLSMKVSDGGTRRIRSEVAKAGEGAYYVFDYGDYENAVIVAPVEVITLLEWERRQKEKTCQKDQPTQPSQP